MIRIMILIPAYKRPEILEITLQSIKALQEYQPEEYHISAFVVYSDESTPPLLRKYQVDGGYHDNLPLGVKKNAALTAIMENYEFDYLMEMGSDDVLQPAILDKYKKHMLEGIEFFGINGCWLYDTATTKAAYWKNSYTIGLGRCVKHSSLLRLSYQVKVKFVSGLSGLDFTYPPGHEISLPVDIAMAHISNGVAVIIAEDVEYNLWGEVNCGLDFSSEITLLKVGIKCKLIESEPEEYLALDIKSSENIHKFEKFTDEIVDVDILDKFGLTDAIR